MISGAKNMGSKWITASQPPLCSEAMFQLLQAYIALRLVFEENRNG